MKNLIIGLGEIGKAVQEVIDPTANIYDIKLRSSFNRKRIINVDIMHICFPYTDSFITQVWDYIAQYEPQHVVVWSTVPMGVTKKLGRRVIHTPVEGKHPDLANSIRLMTRWIGYNDLDSAKFFDKYFKKAKLKTRLVEDTRVTEGLKLLSTTEYGINLMFADYKKRVFDDIDADFELTKEWNRDYNKLYKKLGLDKQFQKFVLDAPEGVIGGHCVRENSRLLNKLFPDKWVERIGKYK
jgi:hypothetical protein